MGVWIIGLRGWVGICDCYEKETGRVIVRQFHHGLH
jgi:hypothetical protein